ncbi:MAG TPA: ASPIC/UnbV domain-containing protein [Planctomycetota bacterium]
MACEGDAEAGLPLTKRFNEHIREIAKSDARNPEVQNRHSALLKDGKLGPMISFSGNEANPFFHRTDRGYEDVGATMGAARIEDSRGLVLMDVDQDGVLDAVMHNHFKNPIVALLNRAAPAGNRWIRLRLRGQASNRFGIGARVTVNKRVLELACGMGYLSGNAPEIHAGLGAAEKAAVEVRWPSGQVDRYEALDANRIWTLREGEIEKAEAVEPVRSAVAAAVKDPPGPVEPDPRPLAGGKAAVVAYFSVDCFACRGDLLRVAELEAKAKAAGLRLIWANTDADAKHAADELSRNRIAIQPERAAEAGKGVEVPRACLVRPGGEIETFVGRYAIEDALNAAK